MKAHKHVLFALPLAVLLAGCAGVAWQGDCAQPDHFQISRLRGHVVGKSLGPQQYRWLRRRFTATGTTLTLYTQHYEDRPGVGPIVTEKFIRSEVLDKFGRFDFGDLPPSDDYVLSVDMPGQDGVGFHFAIDPTAHNTEVLIDASPAYYCRCCGWDFEPR